MEYVIDAGESFMNNCNVMGYKKDFEKAKINGYVFDEYFQTLTLVVSVFENRIEVAKMGKIDITKYSKQATKFYRMCKSGYFDNVEETDPGYIISEYINGYEQEIENIRVILMTNRETTPDIPASVKIDKVMVKFDVWDLEIQKGPANADAASQVQLVEDMINQGVDALCIVPIDPGALESVLKKAMEKGIVVISHEASDLKSTLYDVEAFTAEDFGNTMMQELAKAMGEKGQYAQMVAYTTSTTHMEYSNAEYKYQKENYPDMSLINDTVPSAESSEKVDTAYSKAKELLKANSELAGFTGAASVDILGEAQAVEELGLIDKVSIVGVGTPNATREYVKNGTINAVCLWDPASAGYAMCDLAYKVLSGDEIKEGIDLEQDGYDSVKIQEGVNRCVLGNAPLILNKDNIDDYDF